MRTFFIYTGHPVLLGQCRYRILVGKVVVWQLKKEMDNQHQNVS